MDDRLKELMQELGNAINESLSDSDRIAAAIGEIKRAGYDVFLVLEATIGFNKREDTEVELQESEPPGFAAEQWISPAPPLRFTFYDLKFLSSVKITIRDPK